MSRKPLSLPDTASVANALPDGRLRAPSASRNIAPILDVLGRYVPPAGRALELASGTGEHVVACARAFPHITWQPTDIAPERLASIDAWRAHSRAGNILPARHLDAARPGWHKSQEAAGLIVVVNLLHLIPMPDAAQVIDGMARLLEPGGRAFVYGPFRTGGAFRSDGDARFHASLSGQDARIGYKDLEWVTETAAQAGFAGVAVTEMPANNLGLVFESADPAG